MISNDLANDSCIRYKVNPRCHGIPQGSCCPLWSHTYPQRRHPRSMPRSAWTGSVHLAWLVTWPVEPVARWSGRLPDHASAPTPINLRLFTRPWDSTRDHRNRDEFLNGVPKGARLRKIQNDITNTVAVISNKCTWWIKEAVLVAEMQQKPSCNGSLKVLPCR